MNVAYDDDSLSFLLLWQNNVLCRAFVHVTHISVLELL
jgi:hypothetical protein